MTSDAPPLLSVLMPTYNGVGYVEAALASLAREGGSDVEVVAVDDGSTDGTLEVLRAHAGALRMRIVARGRVGNWVAGSNVALREATGRYACFLHQDDLWLEGRLALVREALSEPGPTLVVGDALFIDPMGSPVGSWRVPFRPAPGIVPERFVERLLVQNFLAIGAPVFDRAAALRAGGLDERLWFTADWDFWLRLAALGPVRHVGRALVAFRVHEGSQTMAPTRRRADFEQQLDAVLRAHLLSWSAGVPPSTARAVTRAARLSAHVNAALAGAVRGEPAGWLDLVRAFAALPPAAWVRFWRDSRLVERVAARARAALRRRRHR